MKLLIILLMVLVTALSANSQSKIEVQTIEKEMSQGSQTAFILMIPKTNTKNVEVLWKKYVNKRTANERLKNFTTGVSNVFKSKEKKTKRTPLKMDKNGDELHVKSIVLESISLYPIDIYAIVNQLPEGCKLSAFFQYSDSTFIAPSNTDENRLNSITDFVRDFGVEAYRDVVDQHIKLANRNLTREERNLKELNAGIQRAEKSIIRDQSLIQQFNSKITELRNDSATMVQDIASKKKEFAQMHKDSVNFDSNKAELKSLEKENATLPREIKILKGKIKSKELDIESAKNQIAQNEIEIKTQEAIIREKQQVAEDLIKEKGSIQ